MTRTSDKHDRYKTVTARFLGTTEKAAKLQRDGDTQWIPYTLMSYSAEELVTESGLGEDLELEIREWKLRELGWV